MADVDLFIVAGQSNAEGRGTAAQSPTVAAESLEWTGSVLRQLADPVGGASTGSAWPAFANAYTSATGRVVCISESANSGAALVAAAASGGGDWSPSGSLFAASVSKAGAALSALGNAGHTPALRGVLWHQGERDAQGGTTQADYQTALHALIDRFQASLDRPSLPLLVFRLGRPTTTDTAGWQGIRAAQDAAAAADPDVHVVYTDCVEFVARGWMADSLHYNQTGLNDMGTVAGPAVADLLASQPSPPAGGSVRFGGAGRGVTYHLGGSVRTGRLIPPST